MKRSVLPGTCPRPSANKPRVHKTSYQFSRSVFHRVDRRGKSLRNLLERLERQQWFSKEVAEVILFKDHRGRVKGVSVSLGRYRQNDRGSIGFRQKGKKRGCGRNPVAPGGEEEWEGRFPCSWDDFRVRSASGTMPRREQAKKSPPPPPPSLVSSGVARLTSYRC